MPANVRAMDRFGAAVSVRAIFRRQKAGSGRKWRALIAPADMAAEQTAELSGVHAASTFGARSTVDRPHNARRAWARGQVL